ncbi:MAG: site-2 protease family protein [Anaerolineales bacterium]
MNSSFRIATVAGIPIRVHITFFLILLLAAYQWFVITDTLNGAVFGAALMALLFVCVTLHELGHSLVARVYGIPVRQIILLPLGGIAQITKNPEKPLHELLIAIAGPLVNVVIAVLLLAGLGFTVSPQLLTGHGLLPAESGQTPSLNTALFWLLAANVSLVVFNLIPAFPLDGGRALRALIAMFTGYPRATRLASAIGQFIAVFLGLYSVLIGHFILTLVAVFIFFGAGQETSEAEAKTVLDTLRVGDAYNKHALTLAVGDRVSRVVDYLLTSYQPDFAVLQGRNPIGIVTRNDVLAALAMHTGDTFVTEMMHREFLKVDAAQSLDEVRRTMAEQNTRIAAVYDGANYLGLVSMEDITEAFAVQTFVERQKQLLQTQANA